MNIVPSISIREKYDTIYLPTSIKNPVELIELKNIFNLFWKPKMFNCTFKFIFASYLNMFASRFHFVFFMNYELQTSLNSSSRTSFVVFETLRQHALNIFFHQEIVIYYILYLCSIFSLFVHQEKEWYVLFSIYALFISLFYHKEI